MRPLVLLALKHSFSIFTFVIASNGFQLSLSYRIKMVKTACHWLPIL